MDLKAEAWELLLNVIRRYGSDIVLQVVLWHLEHFFGITKENYLEDPEKLLKAIDEIYGSASKLLINEWCLELQDLGVPCNKGVLDALYRISNI
ncbi:MAG: hypothetical protein ACP5LW_02755 [Nitrososphaeria archaeon]